MPDDAVATVAVSDTTPLDRRLQAAFEAAARPGGSAASCLALARQLPAACQTTAHGVALGNDLSVWHAPWTSPGVAQTAWLLGRTRVRRLTWAPRVRQLGGATIVEVLLDGPVTADALAVAVFAANREVRLVRLTAPRPADQFGAFVQATGAAGPALLSDWLNAFKPFLPRAPDAARVLLAAERLHRRPVAAGAVDPRQPAGDGPFGFGVDFALPLPDGSVFAKGWTRDPLDMLADLTVSSAFATTVPLPPHVCADPTRPGWRAFLSRSEPMRDPGTGTQIGITARLHGGHAIRVVPPQPFLSATESRDLILRTVPMEALSGPGKAGLLDAVLMPALGALQAAHLRGARVDATHSIGRPSTRPAWSVIVPLYRNLRFLRHQMAAFGLNPALAGVELVCVLDSPEQAEELDRLLRGLHMAFGVSVRVVVHSRNIGFAGAINSGVAASRGERVLLLNSDVIPLASADPWLARLHRHLDRPAVGAVGPKLLFDDDSLQHAGLYWERDDHGEWYNRHYYKGYPRDYAPAGRSRAVPAVTGACLAVRRATFERVGGLSEDYVIGDYEDSDFCLKVRAAGLTCRYAADVELYHMERQSITQHNGYERTPACLYNRRLHHARWDATITAITARRAGREAVR
ncbi:glycosyltransferase [Azospirillum sp. sgz301742]